MITHVPPVPEPPAAPANPVKPNNHLKNPRNSGHGGQIIRRNWRGGGRCSRAPGKGFHREKESTTPTFKGDTPDMNGHIFQYTAKPPIQNNLA